MTYFCHLSLKTLNVDFKVTDMPSTNCVRSFFHLLIVTMEH